MTSHRQIDTSKVRSSAAWLLFGIGLGIVVAAWLVWTELTGLSFWTSPNTALALRVRYELLGIGIVIGALGPLLSKITLRRRLGLCALSALAVGITYFLLGIVWVCTYGV